MSIPPKILIVEDDPDLARLLSTCCSGIGFSADIACDGEEGLNQALTGNYILLILDIGLPKLNGFEVCRKVRSERRDIGILMLTSRAKQLDRVLGLDTGADDYVIKPFETSELVARIKALARRVQLIKDGSSLGQAEVQKFGALEMNRRMRTVVLAGKQIELTVLEFDVLYLLISDPGRPHTREELMREIWGFHSSHFSGSVTRLLSRLRSKLESTPGSSVCIKTIRGIGYCATADHE